MKTKEETTINERVQQIIHHYNLNISSFSKAIGLTNNMTIGNVVSGRKSKPSYEVLCKIVKCFPINPSWLLIGKGTMILEAEEESEMDEEEINTIANTILEYSEVFEKNLIFASYLESKCNRAIVEHQDEMLLKRTDTANLSK